MLNSSSTLRLADKKEYTDPNRFKITPLSASCTSEDGDTCCDGASKSTKSSTETGQTQTFITDSGFYDNTQIQFPFNMAQSARYGDDHLHSRSPIGSFENVTDQSFASVAVHRERVFRGDNYKCNYDSETYVPPRTPMSQLKRRFPTRNGKLVDGQGSKFRRRFLLSSGSFTSQSSIDSSSSSTNMSPLRSKHHQPDICEGRKGPIGIRNQSLLANGKAKLNAKDSDDFSYLHDGKVNCQYNATADPCFPDQRVLEWPSGVFKYDYCSCPLWATKLRYHDETHLKKIRAILRRKRKKIEQSIPDPDCNESTKSTKSSYRSDDHKLVKSHTIANPDYLTSLGDTGFRRQPSPFRLQICFMNDPTIDSKSIESKLINSPYYAKRPVSNINEKTFHHQSLCQHLNYMTWRDEFPSLDSKLHQVTPMRNALSLPHINLDLGKFLGKSLISNLLPNTMPNSYSLTSCKKDVGVDLEAPITPSWGKKKLYSKSKKSITHSNGESGAPCRVNSGRNLTNKSLLGNFGGDEPQYYEDSYDLSNGLISLHTSWTTESNLGTLAKHFERQATLTNFGDLKPPYGQNLVEEGELHDLPASVHPSLDSSQRSDLLDHSIHFGELSVEPTVLENQIEKQKARARLALAQAPIMAKMQLEVDKEMDKYNQTYHLNLSFTKGQIEQASNNISPMPTIESVNIPNNKFTLCNLASKATAFKLKCKNLVSPCDANRESSSNSNSPLDQSVHQLFCKSATLNTPSNMSNAKEDLSGSNEIALPDPEIFTNAIDPQDIPTSLDILTTEPSDLLQEYAKIYKNQIRNLNEQLMTLLMERDELHMEQDSILVDIEDITGRVKDKAKYYQQALKWQKYQHFN